MSGQELRSGYQINGEPMYDFDGLKGGNQWPWAERLWSDAIAYSFFKQAGETEAAKKISQRISANFTVDGNWTDTDQYDKKSIYYGQNWMRLVQLLEVLGAKKMLAVQ